MVDHLFPFYEREIRYLNLLTQEFARRHPGAAARLGLESTGASDIYVKRLLESFALLAGRTHAKIEDEFPELTDPLLQFLYPHFLAPIPAMGVAQFDMDPARGQLPQGFRIDAGSILDAATEPVACKFRTAYPVTLWPIRVNRAHFHLPPFRAGLQPPAGTVAALRLELESLGELTLAQLQMNTLRFFLLGDAQLVPDLYEILFNHVLQVVFQPERLEGTARPISFAPEKCIHPVGFDRDDALLPYPDNARLGYRLLTEFFTYPAKFQFIDLGGWPRLAAAGFGQKCEVFFFCNKTLKSLEQGVVTPTFRLGCTPIVNLFERAAEPVPLRHRQPEYRIVADRAAPQTVEVYSVTEVSSSDPTEHRTTTYPAFHALAHGRDRRLFWHTSRRRSLAENDQGTEVYLSLVNLNFEPAWPADEMLEMKLLCTNRDLPLKIVVGSSATAWNLELSAPIHNVKCLRPPSPPLRPPGRAGGLWELISHLSPSPLSLEEGPGRQALRDILRLYDFSDPAAGQKHLKDQAQQVIEGVLAVNYRRLLGRIPSDPRRGLCRGVEVTVELDPGKFPARGAYLFAAVLERFLGLYATTNSFTQLVARTPLGLLKRWPARTGEMPLV